MELRMHDTSRWSCHCQPRNMCRSGDVNDESLKGWVCFGFITVHLASLKCFERTDEGIALTYLLLYCFRVDCL